jgi:hypothetical protein
MGLRTARTAQRWCSIRWRGEDGVAFSYVGRETFAPVLDHFVRGREGRVVDEESFPPTRARDLHPHDADVRVVDPWLVDGVGVVPDGAVPIYVEARTPLASSLSAQLDLVTNKPLRRKMRQVTRGELKWRATDAWSEFHRFYRDLYAPFAGSRFGPDASVVPEKELALKFARGGVIILAESSVGEHGALLLPSPGEDDALWFAKVGHAVADSPAAPIEIAVFDYCITRGARNLDWGLCAPVTTDGIYVHKRRLGARFRPMRDVPTLPIFVAPGAGPRVFSVSPMLVERDHALEVWAGGDGGQKLLDKSRGGGVPRGRLWTECGESAVDLS